MPKFNHKNLGDILSYVYLPGLILAVYPYDSSKPATTWDTADVEVSVASSASVKGAGKTYKSCPIFYHCEESGVVRENGAIENAAGAFSEGDECVCLCQIKKDKDSKDDSVEIKSVKVIGHPDGIRRCSLKRAFVRISAVDLVPLEFPLGEWVYSSSLKKYVYEPKKKDSHKDEYCIIYDLTTKTFAQIVDPTKDGIQKYSFPCTVEELKPYLDGIRLEDDELFLWEYHGVDPDEVEIAGKFPSLASDFEGKFMGVIPDGSNYMDFYFPNKLQDAFASIRISLVPPPKGAAETGDFSFFDKKIEDNTVIKDCLSRSAGILDDSRTKTLKGPKRSLDDSGLSPEAKTALDALRNQKAVVDSYKTQTVAKKKQTDEFIESTKKDLQVFSKDKVEKTRQLEEFLSTGVCDRTPKMCEALAAEVKNITEQTAAYQDQLDRLKKQSDELSVQIDDFSKKISEIDEEINELLRSNSDSSVCIRPDGSVAKSYSRHIQAAYGETQLYMCARNTFAGMIVSYCDAYWKYMRVAHLPPTVTIYNPALETLANGWYTGTPVGNINLANAAVTTYALGGNSVFVSMGTKCIHEGCVHHTSIQAVNGESDRKLNTVGSYRLTQKANQEHLDEPSHVTALNSRVEFVDAWTRSDNWQNTLKLAFASAEGGGPHDFFDSQSLQWRFTSVYIDTPLGAIAFGSPRLQAGIWWMYRTAIKDSTARNDLPYKSHFVAQTRQNGACCLQLYISQRQSVTAWNKGGADAKMFCRQAIYYGSYDCFNVQSVYELGSEPPAPDLKRLIPSDAIFDQAQAPSVEIKDAPSAGGAVGVTTSIQYSDKEEVRYVLKDGSYVDFTKLTDVERAKLLSDRTYITATTETYAYPLSRNEIEIVGSFDTFASLKKNNGSMDASKAKRNADFEASVKKLLEFFYEKLDKNSDDNFVPKKHMSLFRLEAKIL